MKTVILNDLDVTDLITSYEEYDEMDNEHIIGNTISKQVKLKICNQDGQLEFVHPFLIGDKSYIIYEKPEKWTGVVSLTLYDLMINTNVAYETKLVYPTTISAQLDEMAELSGVTIDKTTLSEDVLNKEVGWYDNTIIIRSYLGFIAECDGKNAFIENDIIVFRSLNAATHEVSFCSNFELNELISFSRVCYDDGIQKLVNGDDSLNTLYVSTNNSYITQSDIDRIYAMYSGFSFYSFKNFKCKEIENIKLTDQVIYYGINILPLSIKRIVYGGEAVNSLELTGDIAIKNSETVIVREEFGVRIKRLQTQVDQTDASLKILSEITEDNKSQIAQLTLDSEEIKSQVSNVESNLAEQTASLSVKMDSIQTNILTSGGNNLIVNSIGVFEDGWDGNVLVDTSTDVKNLNIYGYALSMPAESRKQIIQVPAGTYTLSFLYKKNVELANCSLMVNGTEFILSNTELTEVVHTFEVNAGSITIELNSDTDGSCTLINLMLNQGSQKMVWSLNKAESWTENVKMSASGLEITNAAADVLFSAKADIIGFKNRNTGEYVSVFTDTGMEVDEIVVRKKANIGGLLIQRINDQVIMNNVGGVD